jgi:hypothetical protein
MRLLPLRDSDLEECDWQHHVLSSCESDVLEVVPKDAKILIKHDCTHMCDKALSQ